MTSPTTETGAPADALVIVDAQQGFRAGEGAVPEGTELTLRLQELLLTARRAGAVVVHLQNDGPPGALDEPGQPGWHL